MILPNDGRHNQSSVEIKKKDMIVKRRSGVAALICILVSGCAPTSQNPNSVSNRMVNDYSSSINDSSVVGRNLTEFQSSETNCESPILSEAISKSNRITNRAMYHYSGAVNTAFSNVQRREHRSVYRDIVPLAVNTTLDIGDVALQKGCLDIADRQYREVLEVFVGPSYSAYRERAAIGIEDVRAKR